MSTFFFGYILTQIIGGMLADRYGGDEVMFIAACVWSTCTLITPFVAHILMIPHTIGIGLAQTLAGMSQGQFPSHFPPSLQILKFPPEPRKD